MTQFLKVKGNVIIPDALRNFIVFVEFQKSEKDPWRSVTFNNVVYCISVTSSIVV